MKIVTSEKVIEWKEDVVCYAYDKQWNCNQVLLYGITHILCRNDSQLNEPKEGYYIPKSELDTEEKYNQAVEVFGLFGYVSDIEYYSLVEYGNLFITHANSVHACIDNHDVAKVKLTFNQLMAIGELKRKMNELKLKQPVTDESPDNDLNSGGSCDYYKAPIENPTTATDKYIAECNDIIEALDMTYAEANMFKEIWRTAAARTLGKKKANHTSKRGAEKIIFFAERHGVKHGVKL